MNIDHNVRKYVFLFFSISLIISLILGEDSSGGAKIDRIITEQYVDGFSLGFTKGIKYFISTDQIHSPIF